MRHTTVEATAGADAGAIAGSGDRATRELPAQLGDVEAVRQKCGGISARHIFRMADGGLMPWGCKLGGRRLWKLAEIDAWICSGCKAVRGRKAGKR